MIDFRTSGTTGIRRAPLKEYVLMKKVMVFGTFDVLHPGHQDLFKQAQHHGNYLVAVVARDSTVKRMKNKLPLHNEAMRLANVRRTKLVDEAVLGHARDYYAVVEKHRPDVICLGYDQHSSIADGLKKELAKRRMAVEIVRLNAYKPHTYKSSKILKKMKKSDRA